MSPTSSSEIRSRFLTYFQSLGHTLVPSGSLVPHMDPTLLFTNAGMNQFKGVFTGQETRSYSRAVSSQKCVRAGGKHNDLENVGYTARHHTFFEMLGNFSFGDYFKQEAITYAWTFITKELGLPPEKLYVSVYRDDEEAYQIWTKHVGVAADHVVRLGEKDNFWSMGATGPCGPCSEIYFDQGPSLAGERVGDDGDRFLEFWNLVFMEFEQLPDGSRVRLPKPSIDTGMGLERISAILQNKLNNYDTDLFSPLIEWLLGRMGKASLEALSESQRISCRVISDHIRAMSFLVADGIVPSKEGRGYVLRRIMRRAIRHGHKLGFDKPFLGDLSGVLAQMMGAHYPELHTHKAHIQDILTQEEQQFSKTVDRGLALLADEIAQLKKQSSSVLDGRVAFHLYDTYGFPVDMTADILREQGFSLDQQGFDEATLEHREKARGSWKGSAQTALNEHVSAWTQQGLNTRFLGYETLVASGKVLAIVVNGILQEKAEVGDEIELLADQTPFYGEGGGQVGDIGIISSENSSFVLEVLDTKKPTDKLIVHKCRVADGMIRVGDHAEFQVNAEARAATARNHTATHMLHAILKEVLGAHVQQKGSLVSPERLRFDFSHTKAIDAPTLSRIEKLLNERIWKNDDVQKTQMSLEAAMASGATALFDEKYGAQVRVLSIDTYSKELCGGTHVTRTGDIGYFKIVKETSVAAGIRRIEAYTGHRALRYVEDLDRRLKQASALLGVSPELLETRIETLMKQVKESKIKAPAQVAARLVIEASAGAVPYRAFLLSGADPKSIRDLADRELEKLGKGIVALGNVDDNKVALVIKVSREFEKRVSASDLVKRFAPALGGSGGGRPDMAQAGGDKPEAIEPILHELKTILSTLDQARN